MTDDGDEYVVNNHIGEIIKSKSVAKYVGQNIGSDGRPEIKINARLFGKVIGILKRIEV